MIFLFLLKNIDCDMFKAFDLVFHMGLLYKALSFNALLSRITSYMNFRKQKVFAYGSINLPFFFVQII